MWKKDEVFGNSMCNSVVDLRLYPTRYLPSKMSISGVPGAMGIFDAVSLMILRSDLTSDSRCSTVFITF